MVSGFLSRIFRIQEMGMKGMRERNKEKRERKWMKRGGNDASEVS